MSDPVSHLEHLIHDLHGQAAKFGDAADQLRDADPETLRALLSLIRRNALRVIDLVDAYSSVGKTQ